MAAPAQSFLTEKELYALLSDRLAEENLEEKLTCPLSLYTMYDPQTSNCGHTFEKKELEILRPSKNDPPPTCPLCRKPIETFVPNMDRKDFIAKYYRILTQLFKEGKIDQKTYEKKIKDQYYEEDFLLSFVELDDEPKLIAHKAEVPKYKTKAAIDIGGGKTLPAGASLLEFAAAKQKQKMFSLLIELSEIAGNEAEIIYNLHRNKQFVHIDLLLAHPAVKNIAGIPIENIREFLAKVEKAGYPKYSLWNEYFVLAQIKDNYTSPIQKLAADKNWKAIEILLELLPPQQNDNRQYGCALVHAAKNQNWEFVSKLLSYEHIGLNWQTSDEGINHTFLYYVLKYNQTDLLETIQHLDPKKHYIFKHKVSEKDHSPLQYAIQNTNVTPKTLLHFLNSANIEVSPEELGYALESNQFEKLYLLSIKGIYRYNIIITHSDTELPIYLNAKSGLLKVLLQEFTEKNAAEKVKLIQSCFDFNILFNSEISPKTLLTAITITELNYPLDNDLFKGKLKNKEYLHFIILAIAHETELCKKLNNLPKDSLIATLNSIMQVVFIENVEINSDYIAQKRKEIIDFFEPANLLKHDEISPEIFAITINDITPYKAILLAHQACKTGKLAKYIALSRLPNIHQALLQNALTTKQYNQLAILIMSSKEQDELLQKNPQEIIEIYNQKTSLFLDFQDQMSADKFDTPIDQICRIFSQNNDCSILILDLIKQNKWILATWLIENFPPTLNNKENYGIILLNAAIKQKWELVEKLLSYKEINLTACTSTAIFLHFILQYNQTDLLEQILQRKEIASLIHFTSGIIPHSPFSYAVISQDVSVKSLLILLNYCKIDTYLDLIKNAENAMRAYNANQREKFIVLTLNSSDREKLSKMSDSERKLFLEQRMAFLAELHITDPITMEQFGEINSYFDLAKTGQDHQTLIQRLALKNDWKMIELLVKYFPPTITDPEGYGFALLEAAKNQQWPLVKSLLLTKHINLSNYCYLNYREGNTFLHFLIQHNQIEILTELFRSKKITINLTDENNKTNAKISIASLAEQGKWQLVDLLVKNYPPTSGDPEEYGFALYEAAKNQQWDLVKTLLSYPNICLTTRSSTYSRYGTFLHFILLFNQTQILQELIAKNVIDFNNVNFQDLAPFILSNENNISPRTKLILLNALDIFRQNLPDELFYNHHTSLILTSLEKVTRLLLLQKSDIEINTLLSRQLHFITKLDLLGASNNKTITFIINNSMQLDLTADINAKRQILLGLIVFLSKHKLNHTIIQLLIEFFPETFKFENSKDLLSFLTLLKNDFHIIDPRTYLIILSNSKITFESSDIAEMLLHQEYENFILGSLSLKSRTDLLAMNDSDFTTYLNSRKNFLQELLPLLQGIDATNTLEIINKLIKLSDISIIFTAGEFSSIKDEIKYKIVALLFKYFPAAIDDNTGYDLVLSLAISQKQSEVVKLLLSDDHVIVNYFKKSVENPYLLRSLIEYIIENHCTYIFQHLLNLVKEGKLKLDITSVWQELLNKNQWEMLEMLIKDFPPTAADAMNYGNVLLVAAQNQKWELVETLISLKHVKFSARIFSGECAGFTFLHFILKFNKIAYLNYLIKNFPLNIFDSASDSKSLFSFALNDNDINLATFITLLTANKNAPIDIANLKDAYNSKQYNKFILSALPAVIRNKFLTVDSKRLTDFLTTIRSLLLIIDQKEIQDNFEDFISCFDKDKPAPIILSAALQKLQTNINLNLDKIFPPAVSTKPEAETKPQTAAGAVPTASSKGTSAIETSTSQPAILGALVVSAAENDPLRDPSDKGSRVTSYLQSAASLHKWSDVKKYLQYCDIINFDLKDTFGYTALYYIMEANQHLILHDFLVQISIKKPEILPKCTFELLNSALHITSISPDTLAIKILLTQFKNTYNATFHHVLLQNTIEAIKTKTPSDASLCILQYFLQNPMSEIAGIIDILKKFIDKSNESPKDPSIHIEDTSIQKLGILLNDPSTPIKYIDFAYWYATSKANPTLAEQIWAFKSGKVLHPTLQKPDHREITSMTDELQLSVAIQTLEFYKTQLPKFKITDNINQSSIRFIWEIISKKENRNIQTLVQTLTDERAKNMTDLRVFQKIVDSHPEYKSHIMPSLAKP